MRIILGSILVIFVIIVIAVVAIPFLVSTDWIRDQVVATVNEKTGRTLDIAGRTSLSVFPDLSLTVGQVAFSNPPGRDGDVVRMEELDVGLKLLPLVSGSVEVDRLILTRPVFSLEIDQAGKPNWKFSEGDAAAGGQVDSDKQGARPDSEGGASMLSGIESVQLGDVRIVDGVVSYRDARSGTFEELSAINATLELPSLAQPMKLSGDMSWQGETLSFSTELTEPQALTTGTPTTVAVEIDAPQLKATLNGSLALKDGFALEGSIESSSPSVKSLARWLGTSLPDVAGLGPFSITAGLKADETGVALDNANLSLDDISAEGGLLVGLSGPRPIIRANLAASRIDLRNYIGRGKSSKSATSNNSGGGSSKKSAGPSGGGAWSNDVIDVSALRAFDADLRISATGLRIGNIEVGQSALAVTLKDALLSVDLSELQLYEGRAAGKLTVNGASETLAIAAAFNIDNVAAHPLLAALAGFDWIEGRARITGSLASRGASQRALVGALNGEAKVVFADGAVRGVNIAQMARNLQLGNIVGWGSGEVQKTDFSEFSSSFNIAHGVAQTNDIRLLGPLVRLSGAGVTELTRKTLNFRINPKIVASIQGQGGPLDLTGLEIPILITGTWSNPKIAPDVDAILQDPSNVIDAAKNIGKAVEDLVKQDPGKALENAVKNPADLLNQLTGSTQGGGGKPSPIGEDIFKRLLGQ